MDQYCNYTHIHVCIHQIVLSKERKKLLQQQKGKNVEILIHINEIDVHTCKQPPQ